MNYKHLVESTNRDDWKIDKQGRVMAGRSELLINGVSLPVGNHPLAPQADANARLICHHKRHFDRLVEALRGLNAAYNQGRMPTLEERTACRLALADADKVE